MKDEYIYIPRNITEMQCISRDYNTAGLPGCVGSMDVVHVKWANCPTGDHNHAKGKEGYPTLVFQCLTDFNCRVMVIYGPQFGSHNDKDIVKHDDNVRPSDLIGCLPIQCGNILMPTEMLNQREVCT
jgi:hypothetical protein